MMGAMRNFNLLIKNTTITANSATVDVGDTSGLVPGMVVTEYAEADFTNGSIDTNSATPVTNNIALTTIAIGEVVNSTTITLVDSTTGNPYLAAGTTNTAWLYFRNISIYAQDVQYIDLDITQDTTYPECENIATAISGYFDNINLILSGNASQVVRVEPPIESRSLTGRSTLFTVDTGLGQTDPHGFQTGTPVRLIPRATNEFVDKRLVRLPRGFQTNTVYYVIAPGRETYPYTFSGTSEFDSTAETGLMLAATKENAAAGIYIYSSETESVDPGVEILIQQYVLDEPYDLHRYVTNVGGGTVLETDIPHIFDIPLPNVPAQTIFFRTSSDANSALPEISGAGAIPTDVYYYPRYVTKTKFSVHATQADAQAGVNALVFNPGMVDFIVYGNKKTSPLKYDASNYGRWY